jgi:hypothetical protein
MAKIDAWSGPWSVLEIPHLITAIIRRVRYP